MKAKINRSIFFFLLVLGGTFSSANLLAQNVQGPSLLGEPADEKYMQVRLHALDLCKDFYLATLSPESLQKLDSYSGSLTTKVTGLPAYVPGPVENYVYTNRNATELAKRYIKCQAIIAFPEGYNMTEPALNDVEAELNDIAAQIASIK